MLVHFKFYRVGYFAEGLVEHESLDSAGEALMKENPLTFKWKDIQGPENENRLTLEEWNERSSTEQVESEAKPGSPVGK